MPTPRIGLTWSRSKDTETLESQWVIWRRSIELLKGSFIHISKGTIRQKMNQECTVLSQGTYLKV
jgi:hypothetical protein